MIKVKRVFAILLLIILLTFPVSAGWTEGETRNYTFEGPSENNSTYSISLDTGIYEIEVHGADGNPSGGNEGVGGYIKGNFSSKTNDALEIWVGQAGQQPGGGWGRRHGGDGHDGGGGGGGSTEVLINDDLLAVADGGGGGVWATNNPGGGGARGGLGGTIEGNSADDGEGTGYGGKGGNESYGDGYDAGQEAGNELNVLEQQNGGATKDSSGNGYVELTYTDAWPTFESQKILWENIGQSESKKVNYSINHPSGDEISDRNSPPSGSVDLFSNSTYQISGISSPFDYIAEITDFAGDSATVAANYTLSKTGYQENSYSNTLGTQRIEYSATIENRGNPSDYLVSMTGTGTSGESVVQGPNWDGTLSSGESITHTSVFEADYVTGEAESEVRMVGENGSQVHSLGTQYILKETELVADNSRSFSFSGVDLSSRCENTGSADVPSGTGVQISGNCSTVETTGDWINNEQENTYSKYSDADYDHSEDTQRIHNQTELLTDNDQGFGFTDVDISVRCSQISSADVPSGTGIQVTNDCNRPTFTGDWISESTSSVYENSGYSHDLDAQGVSKDKTLSEDGGYSWTGVDVSAPSISGTCSDCGARTVDLAAAGSATETYHAASDWITGESEHDIRTVGENSSASHSLGTQHILNETELVAENTRSFSFTGVDLSGRCENTGSSNVASGPTQLTSNCSTVERSGDWISSEKERSYSQYEASNFDHGEDEQELVNQTELIVDNTRSFEFSGVDLSSICSQTTTAPVASGTSVQVTSDCSRPTFSVDKISQSVGSEYEDTSFSHSVSSQGVALDKTLSEQAGISWSQVNISAPSVSGSCSNCGQRKVDISASSTVIEVYNATSDWIVNESEQSFEKYSDSGYNHSEDQQQIANRTKLVVDNSQSFGFTGVDISSECSQTSTGDVDAGSDVEATLDCNRPTFSGDWISVSVNSLSQDSGKKSDLKTQYLEKTKSWSEDGGYNWSSVNVSSPRMPGNCSNCGNSLVDFGPGASKSKIYHSEGDWIRNVSSNGTRYGSGKVVYGAGVDKEFSAVQTVEAANALNSLNMDINMSSRVERFDACTLQNSTVQSIAANGSESLDFQKTCDPGDEVSHNEVYVTERSDEFEYNYSGEFEVYTNLTSEQEHRYAIPVSRLSNWTKRNEARTEAVVDGKSENVSLENKSFDGEEYAVVVVGDEFSNSSLYTGNHTASITYFEEKETSGGGGGGSIGGGSGYEEEVSGNYNWSVSLDKEQDNDYIRFFASPGETVEETIYLENTGDRSVGLDLRCVAYSSDDSDVDVCEWVSLSVNSVELGTGDFTSTRSQLSVSVPANLSESGQYAFDIRVEDPSGTFSEVEFLVNANENFIVGKLTEATENGIPFVVIALLAAVLVFTGFTVAVYMSDIRVNKPLKGIRVVVAVLSGVAVLLIL